MTCNDAAMPMPCSTDDGGSSSRISTIRVCFLPETRFSLFPRLIRVDRTSPTGFLTVSFKRILMKERKNFEGDERKQKYNSLGADNVNVTAEEYEACAARNA